MPLPSPQIVLSEPACLAFLPESPSSGSVGNPTLSSCLPRTDILYGSLDQPFSLGAAISLSTLSHKIREVIPGGVLVVTGKVQAGDQEVVPSRHKAQAGHQDVVPRRHKVQAGSRTQYSRTRAASDVSEDMETSSGNEGQDKDLETDRDVETLAVCGRDVEVYRDVETLAAGDGSEGKDKEASRDVETVEADVGGNLQVGQETCGD
ncbi:hypothetical protein CRENBAI_018198 [Crenichthys baileyi]|uniref:Uncharacterized protein n=1 Tax=Crenichthys baileyi TaxID=28760 RepID=A0AAV9SP88_9TELE